MLEFGTNNTFNSVAESVTVGTASSDIFGFGIVYIPGSANVDISLSVLKPGASANKDDEDSWHTVNFVGVEAGKFFPIPCRRIESFSGNDTDLRVAIY